MNLQWTGKSDNLKSGMYTITTFKDGRIWGTAGPITATFDSVDVAKGAAQKHHDNYNPRREWI